VNARAIVGDCYANPLVRPRVPLPGRADSKGEHSALRIQRIQRIYDQVGKNLTEFARKAVNRQCSPEIFDDSHFPSVDFVVIYLEYGLNEFRRFKKDWRCAVAVEAKCLFGEMREHVKIAERRSCLPHKEIRETRPRRVLRSNVWAL
jgi:hypothetical protein